MSQFDGIARGALIGYPVVVNGIMLSVFGGSLLTRRSAIERIARRSEPNLPARGVIYCRWLTRAWCIFFTLNIVLSFVLGGAGETVMLGWYSWVISYVLGAILLFGERLVRPLVKRGSLFAVLVPSLLLTPPEALAFAPDIEAALARLRIVEQVRSDFIETRTFPGLDKAVESSGTFLYVKGRGTMWHASAPKEHILIVSPKFLKEGASASDLSVQPLDDVAEFSKMMLGLLSGDSALLERSFTVERKERPNALPGWCLELLPRDELREYLRAVTLCGSDVLEELTYSTGDEVVVKNTFFHSVRSAVNLTPEESRFFGFQN